MSDEQKIEGVPEGWRLVRVAPPHDWQLNTNTDLVVPAYLERIPRPKQSVIVAEWDVTKLEHRERQGGPGFTAPRAYIGGRHRNCDRFRLEERDEPSNGEPKPKRRILMAEAEVPPDFRIDGNGAILIYRSGAGVSQDIHRFPAEVLRIEERDA